MSINDGEKNKKTGTKKEILLLFKEKSECT